MVSFLRPRSAELAVGVAYRLIGGGRGGPGGMPRGAPNPSEEKKEGIFVQRFQTLSNRFSENNGVFLCHIGPDHWLLRAPLNREAALNAQLKPADAPADISVVRISDTQTFFRITGPEVAEVISIGCPMDVHKTAFPLNGVSFSEFFTVKALILRNTSGFDVAIEQSYANMIADYLNRATA